MFFGVVHPVVPLEYGFEFPYQIYHPFLEKFKFNNVSLKAKSPEWTYISTMI